MDESPVEAAGTNCPASPRSSIGSVIRQPLHTAVVYETRRVLLEPERH